MSISTAGKLNPRLRCVLLLCIGLSCSSLGCYVVGPSDPRYAGGPMLPPLPPAQLASAAPGIQQAGYREDGVAGTYQPIPLPMPKTTDGEPAQKLPFPTPMPLKEPAPPSNQGAPPQQPQPLAQPQPLMPFLPPPAPREMSKVTLAHYVIEPPDLLLLEVFPTLPEKGPIDGERLVRPDGTISLGLYGEIRVAGLTIAQAKAALEKHLKQYIKPVQVNVDVYSYNSKFYYVIADGAGYGEQIARLPFSANETVLDAISQVGGLPQVASKKHIWIARPSPMDPGGAIILPVDWEGITRRGQLVTNYQLLPGDRIYIQADRLIALNGFISKVVAPIERLLGVSLLGATTIQGFQNLGQVGGGVSTGVVF